MEKESGSVPWIWGFTNSAENWNGRLAMLGFFFYCADRIIYG
jgi:hypothetical protein